MKTNVLSILCIALLLTCTISCVDKTAKTIDGNYASIGYGRVLTIAQGEFLLSDVTTYSCIPLMTGELADFEAYITYKNDTITLRQDINVYQFARIDKTPAICDTESQVYKEAVENANDPLRNFEALWDTFKEHYAYFELRNIDPEVMYATYRPKITQETTPAQFYLIVSEMLDSFNDGHIGISAPDEVEEAAEMLYLEKHPVSENEGATPQKELRNYVVSKMVSDRYIPKGTAIKNGNIRWGMLENKVGYLQLNQMMGIANYNISDTLSYRDHWMAYLAIAEESEHDNKDEITGINSSLDTILEDFKDTEALIIDVRFNGGGKDEVGMAVLRRLTSEAKVTFTKMGKHKDGFTPVNNVVQPAVKTPYAKPVFLLIGPESASATEIMALSAMSIPTITSIGSRTEGVFSDMLDKELPNGWEFSLSNEVYLDLEGNNYEGVGIPPAIEIGYPRPTQAFLEQIVADLITGDKAIEKALSKIN